MRGALANQHASPASNGGAGDRAIETGTGKLGENWKRRDLPRLFFFFVLPRILAWNSSAISVPHAVAGLVEDLSIWAVFRSYSSAGLDYGLVLIGLFLREGGSQGSKLPGRHDDGQV